MIQKINSQIYNFWHKKNPAFSSRIQTEDKVHGFSVDFSFEIA